MPASAGVGHLYHVPIWSGAFRSASLGIFILYQGPCLSGAGRRRYYFCCRALFAT